VKTAALAVRSARHAELSSSQDVLRCFSLPRSFLKMEYWFNIHDMAEHLRSARERAAQNFPRSSKSKNKAISIPFTKYFTYTSTLAFFFLANWQIRLPAVVGSMTAVPARLQICLQNTTCDLQSTLSVQKCKNYHVTIYKLHLSSRKIPDCIYIWRLFAGVFLLDNAVRTIDNNHHFGIFDMGSRMRVAHLLVAV